MLLSVELHWRNEMNRREGGTHSNEVSARGRFLDVGASAALRMLLDQSIQYTHSDVVDVSLLISPAVAGGASNYHVHIGQHRGGR